jgi:hypothetical protein
MMYHSHAHAHVKHNARFALLTLSSIVHMLGSYLSISYVFVQAFAKNQTDDVNRSDMDMVDLPDGTTCVCL